MSLHRRPEIGESLPIAGQNYLFASLAPSIQAVLRGASTAMELPVGFDFWKPNEVPQYAYLPFSGLASVVTPMMDGGSAEVEMIGVEGVTGAVALLGPVSSPTRCFMQFAGNGLRMEMDSLRALYRNSAELQARVQAFLQVQSITTSQIAGCNALHDTETRLIRWLLMTQDRTQLETLPFTQEWLGAMIGARRTTVTMIAGSMQRSGLIAFRRGRITLLDRSGLEDLACTCYTVAKRLYDNLLKQWPSN